MKKILSKFLAVVLLMIMVFSVTAIPVSAATEEPSIYINPYETDISFCEGTVGKLSFIMFNTYDIEKYVVEIYDADGELVGGNIDIVYPEEPMQTLTLEVNTETLQMEMGTYTVKYWMEYYSNSTWYKTEANEFPIVVVSNVCNGNHNYVEILLPEGATCTEPELMLIGCLECGHCYFEEYYADHEFDSGTVVTKPTLTSDGLRQYTCLNCPKTKDETIPKLSITKQPENVWVAEGKTAKATVTATGEGLTYKWYYKESWGTGFALTTSFTGDTYSVTMNDARNGREIYCVVSDKHGNSVKSNTVKLTKLNVAKITKQPTSVTVENGKSVNVKVGATGSGLTYKWYYKNKGASSFALTTTFTGDTYSTTMSDARDGRQIYCVITDKYGNSVKSNVVTISKKIPIKITKWLANASAENGKTVTVSIGAQGNGLKYKWYYKEKGGKAFALTTSFTGNTYSVTMSDARNGRQIYCVVTDQYGKYATSNTVTISKRNVAKITTQPVSVKVANGKNATVTLKATGDGLKYKWYYKESWGKTFAVTNSFTYNTYSVAMNANRNGRQLYCVVTDKYGNSVKSNVVTIAMAQPVKIKYSPANVSGYIGGKDAKFTVTTTGDGLKYQWQVKTSSTAAWKNTTIAGYNTKTISVGVTAARNGYKYRCIITDLYGNKVTSGAATLYANKHTHSWTSKVTKNATCVNAGVKTFSCYCGISYTQSIAATGHSWKAATCTAAKKCTKCSATSGSALGHSMSNGKCSRCEYRVDVVLYDDSNIKITFDRAEKSKYYDDKVELYFNVENKIGRTLYIQADAVAINGYSFSNLIMSDSVAAYTKGTVKLTVNDFDFENININAISSIGGQFCIIDDTDDTYFDIYEALFENIKLDGTGKGSRPTNFTKNNLVYSDANCNIYYKNVAKSEYYEDNADVYFYVENKTNRALTFQAEVISLNGYSFSDLIMSDTILPNTVGIIELSIANFDFYDVNINNITKIGGQFIIIDETAFDYYDAIFTNVSVK